MPPKDTKAKYFQKSDPEEETQPEPEEVKEEKVENEKPKKQRKPRATMEEKGIVVPVEMLTISKAKAKQMRRELKGDYVMSEKQKANVERLKLITQERKLKRIADTEAKEKEEKAKAEAKAKEEALILAKAKRVHLTVKPVKKRTVKPKAEVIAPKEESESEEEEEEEEDEEDDYVPTPQPQPKKKVVKRSAKPVSDSEDTDALISKVKNIKQNIEQVKKSSILDKFF